MENELYSLDENELEQLRKKLKKEYGVEKLKVFSSSVLMGELVLAIKEFYQNGESVANITGINLEGQKELGAIFAIISFVIVILNTNEFVPNCIEIRSKIKELNKQKKLLKNLRKKLITKQETYYEIVKYKSDEKVSDSELNKIENGLLSAIENNFKWDDDTYIHDEFYQSKVDRNVVDNSGASFCLEYLKTYKY